MQVSRVVRELVVEDDPDAAPYQTPCTGCVGYCELEATEPWHDADDPDHCNGRHNVRTRVMWRVTIGFTHDGIYLERGASAHESSEVAEANAMAEVAATCIRLDRRDD